MLQHGLVNKAHILLHLCFCDQLFGFSGQTTNCTTIALGCCTPSSCRIFNLTVLYAVKECYLFLIGACTCSSSCLPSSPFCFFSILASVTNWLDQCHSSMLHPQNIYISVFLKGCQLAIQGSCDLVWTPKQSLLFVSNYMWDKQSSG